MPYHADLELLYEEIEQTAFDFLFIRQIGDLFQKLKDRFTENGDKDNARLAQYEVDAFNLMGKDGKLGHLFVLRGDDGAEVEWPDIAEFPEEELDYFTARLDKTNNPRLKARYAHILWQSLRKRDQHARTAIKAYLKQIPHLEKLKQKDKIEGLDLHSHNLEILGCVKACLCLAISSKKLIAEVISVMKRLIHDAITAKHSRHTYIHDLIECVIENRKHFESEYLSSLPTVCLDVCENLFCARDFHGAIAVYGLGARIDQIQQSNTVQWDRKIAECYEMLMDSRKRSPIVAAEWCQRAMDHYKVAGVNAKVEELARKRAEFSKGIKFTRVSSTVDQTKHIAWCKSVGARLANESTDKLLGAIALNPMILPLRRDMELLAGDMNKEAPLLGLIPTTILDDRLHVAEHAASPEEKQNHALLEAFGFTLQIDKVPLINEVIYQGYQSKKLSAAKVLRSLKKLSWIGYVLKHQRGSTPDYTYCWIDQIRPALEQYFGHMRRLLAKKELKAAPILAIDSLATKFEGLVRDYALLNGCLTHIDRKDKANRPITREKDLSLLLHDPRIASLFTPDDLLFFKFLFVEQSGFTLRHRVAHGLMLLEDYNFGILQLLFVALMRLAKYTVPK